MSDDTSNTDTHNSIIMVTNDFSCELNNHFSIYEKLLLGPVQINRQLKYQQEYRKQFKIYQRFKYTSPFPSAFLEKTQTHALKVEFK